MAEETHIIINETDLIDLTGLAYGKAYPGMYPTCGGSDAFNTLFAYRERVTDERLKELQGKLTGVKKEGELITLDIVKLDELWKKSPDAKALAALCLYDKLFAQKVIKDF